MSAEFVAAYLSIPADKKPSWESGYRLIEEAKENDELFDKLAKGFEYTDPLLVKKHKDGNHFKDKVLNYARQALDFVKDAWENWDTKEGNIGVFDVRCPNGWISLLLVADSTWGDPVPGTEEIAFLQVSGLAKAVGFLG